MKTLVFLDTNFFMMPYNERIDVFSEIERLLADTDYELVTVSSVEKELVRISEKAKGKDKVAASVGLGLLAAKKVKIMESVESYVDKELIRRTAEGRSSIVVCTNDKALRAAVKASGGRVISMRGRTHLEFV